MQYICKYQSPLGGITVSADGNSLTGLWFDGQKYFAATLPAAHEEKQLPVFDQTQRWLDCYFSGKNPGFTPPLGPEGSPFRQACPAQDPLPVLWAYLPAAARLRR